MNASVIGLPGIKTERSTKLRKVLHCEAGKIILPQSFTIDNTVSRDPTNTGDIGVLQAGMVMGIITANKKVAPGIIGLTTVAYTSGGTSLTVSAATATELVRRIGASGSFNLTGAPTAGGTVAATSVAYSAVNTGTGVITITNIGADRVAGSVLQPADGSQTFAFLIPDGYGVPLVDQDGNFVDNNLPEALVGGVLNSNQLINYPPAADTTLRAWYKAQLRAVGYGFVFTDDFGL